MEKKRLMEKLFSVGNKEAGAISRFGSSKQDLAVMNGSGLLTRMNVNFKNFETISFNSVLPICV
jgi:hypothetical protein